MNRARSVRAVIALTALAACGGHTLPPGPRDPAASLRLYATFADRVLQSGLDRSFRLAAPGVEATRPRPAPGLTSIVLIEPSEFAALRAQLGSPEELQRCAVVEDAIFAIQSEADPAVAAIVERIRTLRVHHVVTGGIEYRESRLAATASAAERREIGLAAVAAAGESAALVRELARARNRWARARHGAVYLDLAWRHRGFDVETAQRLRAEVAKVLRPAPDEPRVAPWDAEAIDPALIHRLQNSLTDPPEERMCALFAWLGLEARPDGLTFVVRPPDGGFGAFMTFPVAPPGDVRVVLAPSSGLFAEWATLHELGHAAQALLARGGVTGLDRRTASLAVAESCGKLCERLAFEPEWLRRGQLAETEIDAIAAWERRSERWRVRSILADTAFEEALYADPDGDLDAAYVAIQRLVAGVAVPPEARSGWAAEKNLVFKPLARFDYLLARCAEAAVYRRLRTLPGGLLGAESGRVVRDEVLGAAAGRRYETWFRDAAEIEPSCSAWLEDVAFAGGTPPV